MTTDVPKNRTVIGADCHLRGELWLDNDLLMMGDVEGTLQVMGLLDLPGGAKVQGQVMCTRLRLAGHVDAHVMAEESVELLPGAFFSGKLYTPKLLMHEGATLEAEVCVGPHALERAKQIQELIPESPGFADAVQTAESTRPQSPTVAVPAAHISSAASTLEAADSLRGEPVVSTVRTMPESLRSTLERPRLPRVIKGGVSH